MGKTTEFIDRVKARETVCSLCRWEGTSNCEECEHPIDDIPTANVVPVGLLEQVEWERDIALAQLAEIGKSFGEKMDDVRPVVLCRDCKNNWVTTWNHGKQDDPRCDFTDRRLKLNDFCSRGEKREES